MNRRSMFKAAIGVCATLLLPWRKATAIEHVRPIIPHNKEFESILCVGRRQLLHVRQAGMKPVAMRLGRRERKILCEGGLSRGCENPVNFARVPIEWTDNECEMTIVN